ncbi:unnamed protein product [Caenorhabditis sp. 36 PRJEB53466]|nr:unnamed protein product [Caenorhabditis sp. 36 PRJEB53466]
MLALQIIQYVGFVSAQLTNATLLCLIAKRADRKKFGSYRYLMLVYAAYSLVYAWIEVVTQPVMHILPPVYVVYMDSPLKPYNLHKIENGRLYKLILPCLFYFVAWFEFIFWGMENTREKQEYLREELKTYYNEDSTRVSFIAGKYWRVSEEGHKIWNVFEIFCTLGCVFIITSCFSTIVYCASHIYTSIKGTASLMSHKALDLNRQLLATLTFQATFHVILICSHSLQTVLPFFMMYSPVGLLLTLPIFQVHVGRFANFTGASLAVYPSLEPLVAIFCIKDFRAAVFGRSEKKIALQPIGTLTSIPS